MLTRYWIQLRLGESDSQNCDLALRFILTLVPPYPSFDILPAVLVPVEVKKKHCNAMDLAVHMP